MTQDALADLARLRSIAEEARRVPLVGGRQLILWGVVIALATLVHGAIATRLVPLPMASLSALWALSIGGTLLVARLPAFAGPPLPTATLGSRVEAAVWQAGGAFLVVVPAALLGHAYLTLAQTGSPDGFRLFALMPPITFGVYAIAMRVSAEAAAVPSLKGAAALAIAFAAATILLASSPWQYAVTATGIVLVSILPGLDLVRRERDAG